MKRSLLLPHGFQKIGWVILVPAALLGLLLRIDDFNGSFAAFVSEALLNNVALIGILLGALFVVCARERIEDELIGQLRLNALLAALYADTGFIVVAALLYYGFDFLYVMIYNLFVLPLLFLVIFRWRLWRLRKEAYDEE